MSAVPAYPVRVEGELDPQLSRWLWLVKWLLVIPHAIVLAFLWIAFVLVSIVAFFAILFTGRYPRRLFEFNVGVLRWTWRVSFYCFDANGTDRYPPFTLRAAEYPATSRSTTRSALARARARQVVAARDPAVRRRGVFIGGAYGGLIPLLVLFAVVALLFTGRYPR